MKLLSQMRASRRTEVLVGARLRTTTPVAAAQESGSRNHRPEQVDFGSELVVHGLTSHPRRTGNGSESNPVVAALQ